MHRTRRLIKYTVVLVFGSVALAIVQWPSSKLTMVACDVGQGDAILLTQGTSQVLVDGGPSGQRVLSCLRKHMPFWDRTIEVVVMTNSDADHIGGLADVVSRYRVVRFVSGDGLGESKTFQRLVLALHDAGVAVTGVEQRDTIVVGGDEGIQLRVLWPDRLDEDVLAVFSGDEPRVLGASSRDLNERSVVLELVQGDNRVLLTGDAGFATEEALVSQVLLEDVDVLKVGHHGSKYSSSEAFLRVVRPEIAVVSVGKNSYGHPTSEALGRLESVGARVRRTDVDGTVVVTFE